MLFGSEEKEGSCGRLVHRVQSRSFPDPGPICPMDEQRKYPCSVSEPSQFGDSLELGRKCGFPAIHDGLYGFYQGQVVRNQETIGKLDSASRGRA